MMVDPRTLFRPRRVGGAVTAAYFLVASHAFLYLTVAAAYFLVASHALYLTVAAAYFLVASHSFLYFTVAAAYFLVASHALYSGDATSPAKLLSF